MLYLWLIVIGLQTFVLPDEMPMELPQETVVLMFVLYGIISILLLLGTIVSVMINNGFYTKFFGGMIIIVFASLLAAKGMFG
jgi:hypothetical protein